MKNKIKNIFKILVVTAGCLIFASFSPSLDGRAVVVDDGVFPQGLFAKTVGYLPGDIISVTNIAGDTTVDLLVIGALDPSEGVAIMLSPEAAQAMGIDKGANNIVKITKRSGQDERVYGNAVISKSAAEIEDWDDSNFENISAEETKDAFEDSEEENLTEAPVEETEDTETAFEDAEEEEEEAFEENEESFGDNEKEDFENEEAFDEDQPEEEAVEEEFVEEEAFEEETLVDEAIDEEDEEESLPLDEAEEESEEYTEETPEALEEDVEEEAFDADELNELPEEETEALEEENVDEESMDNEIPEETPVEEAVSEEAFDEEAPAELPEEEEKTDDDIPSEEAFEADELESLPAEEEAEVEEEAVEEAETDEYEAIVLVPADSNPPESENDEVEDVAGEDELESIEEETTLIPLPVEDRAKTVIPPAPVEKNTAAKSYDKYMVPSLKNLESGKYYIQIAVYASDENILEVINKYGSNYPITIVPMAGGNKKQVLVGPVTMDEYKVVLERFKSYGFKDAFLRKVR